MEIRDLTGLGEPISKLIDAIRSAIGVVFEPTDIRRRAQAKADELRLLQAAKTEADIESAKALATLNEETLGLVPGISPDVLNRARQRLTFLEVARQKNIESIVANAIDALPQTVSSDPIDSTWLKRFLSNAADIDDEKMQGLWGKVLAGETAAPGRFSLRSIEILKNLSQREAEVFVSACHLVMGANDYIVVIPSTGRAKFLVGSDQEAMGKFELDLPNTMALADAGLIHPDMLLRTLKDLPFTVYNNGKWLKFERLDLEKEMPDSIPIIRFTEAGRAIGGLVGNNFRQDYFDLLAERYKGHGLAISQTSDPPNEN